MKPSPCKTGLHRKVRSGSSTKGWAFTISGPILVTQLGPCDPGNNRLKIVSRRNHLDQHRHADGTILLALHIRF